MNTYTILEEKREDVTKKLARYQKKAEKYGVPFSVEFGEPYAVEIKHGPVGFERVDKYEVFDLSMETEIIKNGDYSILARIEHSPSGNVVNAFADMQKRWATMAPFCEHCNSNHNLKYTFIVNNGTEEKQVGRTCLKDYCGIDPQGVGIRNEFVDDIDEFTVEHYEFFETLQTVYDTEEMLAFAIETVREQGYIRSDERDSNKSKISKKIGLGHPQEADMAEAHRIAVGIANLSLDDAIDLYLDNVQTRIRGMYCKPSDFGYIAYAPVAFARYEKRVEEMKRRAEERTTLGNESEYVGTIGERAEFTIKEAKLLTCYTNAFGITYLYRFIDDGNNVLIWFASSSIDTDNISKIKATIKDHKERDGVKQTIITRAKVISNSFKNSSKTA